ncbi:MAG: hypothetical protein WBS54_03040 [Acidobacteriota bacterium]
MIGRWKWLVFVLLFVCVCEALYLAVGTWALRSGMLARLLSRKPERVQIEWSGGRTVWPGVFHLEGVRIRGQSERTQTYIQVDHCTVRMHLILLAVCRVYFYRMEGSGFSLWVRHRREPGKPHPLDRYEPPIPGLEQDAPPPGRKPYPSPWTVHFGSARITQLREIWIGPYKTTGQGSAEGDVDYHLRGPLTVKRALLKMRGATTVVSEEVIASHVQAELDATIDSVVVREHRGRPFLRYVSGRYRIRGQVGSLAFLNEALGKRLALSFKGRGALATDFTLEHGTLGPNSRITWEGPDLQASAAGFTARGKGSLSGGTGTGNTSISLAFHWSSITVIREGEPPISIEGPGLTATVAGPRLDMASDGEKLVVTVDLPESSIKDLSSLRSHTPPKVPLAILPGSPALLKAHLQFRDQRAKGWLFVDGNHVRVRTGAQSLLGGFYAEIKLKSGDVQSRMFDISGTKVGMRDAAFSNPGGPAMGEPWSGDALVSEGSLHSTVPGNLNVKVELKMTDTRPVVALFAANNTYVRWFKGFLNVKDVTGTAGLATDGTSTVINNVDVQGKGLEMLGRMRVKGNRLDGAFYAHLHHLSAAVSIENGKREWKLINARQWYDALP